MTNTGSQDKNPFKRNALAFLLSIIVRVLYRTLRVSVKREALFNTLRHESGSVLLITWHGRCFIPIARPPEKGYYALVSLSRDGDLMSDCFRRLHWGTIRGSTGRGGAAAMKAALGLMSTAGRVLAIAPDGPRGPARKVQPGVVLLARKSGRPILPVGVSMAHCWQAKSWDGFQIPKPFSRVQLLFGEPFFVSPDANIEEACLDLEKTINALEEEARQALEAM